jgi:flagellar hook-associated protein 1 FlgK
VNQSDGQVNVLVNGVPLVLGNQAIPLQLTAGSGGQLVLTAAGSATPLTVGGGTLGAVLQLKNEILPQYQQQLASFASGVVGSLDEAHAQGVGTGSGLTVVDGTRGVANVKVPLAKAGLAFPVQSGSLYVGVTDQATGQRTVHQINIDPATQSLQDVAAALNGIGGVQAVVNSQTGTLSLLASSGFTFDFAGPSTNGSQPGDTSGILAALGLNTLFTGTVPGNFQVSQDLVQDPSQLAISTSGAPADATNLQRLLATQDQPLPGGAPAGQTFSNLVGAIGTQVQDLTTQQTAQKALGQQLASQQQGVSGVDPNEELVKMLQYQQGFQLSAKYITVVNDTMQSLLQIF